MNSAENIKSITPEQSQNPEFWLGQIDNAMMWLYYDGYRQKVADGGICVDSVDKNINKLGDSLVALKELNYDMSTVILDLIGLPDVFISEMSIHPATAEVAKQFENMKNLEWLKEGLVKKYGTREERSRRLKSSL